MFKKFVEKIAYTPTEKLMDEVFYGENGIDRAFQKEKITWKEHQMLLHMIGRIQGLRD